MMMKRLHIYGETIQKNNITNMDITFFIREDENDYIRFDEEHKERAYKEEEIEEIIINNGFKILRTLDNYEDKKN